MEMLDHYLEAVRKHLPWQRQDDIIAELRTNLEAQLEEKEETLGRPLNKGEMEAWLKQLGSPIHMAAPYQTQQYLIGPAVFPIYRYVLKLACSWALVIYAIANVVKMFASQNPSGADLLGVLLQAPAALIYTAAWCTLVFAVIEYAIAHRLMPPNALGPMAVGWAPGVAPPFQAVAARGKKKPHSFAQAVAEVFFGILFLGWLLLVPKHPWLLMGPGVYYLNSSPYQLAYVVLQFYWCVIAINVLQLAWNLENLISGGWEPPQPVKALVFKAAALIPFGLIATAHNHVVIMLRHPALDQGRFGANVEVINRYVYLSATILCIILIVQLIGEIWHMLRDGRMRAAAIR